MSMHKQFHRGALAGALALLLAGAAFAGESLSDVTRVQVRTEAGQIEAVSVSDLEVGQVRAVVTEAGNPAVISRSETGIKLEVANEIFEANVPGTDVDAMIADLGADGGKTQVIKRELHREVSESGENKRIVIVKRHDGEHDGEAASHAMHLALEGDGHDFAEPSLADPELAGKRILVTRRIERQTEVASQ